MTNTPKHYKDAGWDIVPLVKGEKRAATSWNSETYDPSDFKPDDGIAVKCGEPSGWRVDVDLDCMEAVEAAKLLLPSTGLIHGRPSKPLSHYWYVCKDIKTKQFTDIKGADGKDGVMLVEIRSTGGYTAVPPSVHPSGGVLAWESELDPMNIENDVLSGSVRDVALAALLAKHWNDFGHHATGPLAGFLCRGGVTDVVRIITTAGGIAGASADIIKDARDFAERTVAKFKAGENVTGGPKLEEHLSKALIDKMRSWLKVAQSDDELLAEEVTKLRRRRQAKTIVDAEENPPQPMPVGRSLADRLSVKRVPKPMRIVGWQCVGHRAVLSAQFKAGKTTLVINVTRSLVDEEKFLDHYDVSPVNKVTILDFEMADDDPNQLDEWYDAAGITHKDRVHMFALRGRAAAFNILDPNIRAKWVEALRGTDYLILDCLRPVLDALGLEEKGEAGKFFTPFDALLTEAGIRDALVVHHMGHQNERSRGDSRIQDWPDVIWTLVRESEDPASKRFIKAFGRGIDQPETALEYNPRTHRLGIGLGSRRDMKLEPIIKAVLQFVQGEANPPNKTKIEKAVRSSESVSAAKVRDAIKLALKQGNLKEIDTGKNNEKVYEVVFNPF